MKEIEISGANRFETFTKTRAGSRGRDDPAFP